MKILRLLALVGVVSAAVSPAMSQTSGTCSYSCFRLNPPGQKNYSFSATYQQCCDADWSTFCPPGWSAVGVTYNGSRCPL